MSSRAALTPSYTKFFPPRTFARKSRRPEELPVAPTNCPWVSEDANSQERWKKYPNWCVCRKLKTTTVLERLRSRCCPTRRFHYAILGPPQWSEPQTLQRPSFKWTAEIPFRNTFHCDGWQAAAFTAAVSSRPKQSSSLESDVGEWFVKKRRSILLSTSHKLWAVCFLIVKFNNLTSWVIIRPVFTEQSTFLSCAVYTKSFMNR